MAYNHTFFFKYNEHKHCITLSYTQLHKIVYIRNKSYQEDSPKDLLHLTHFFCLHRNIQLENPGFKPNMKTKQQWVMHTTCKYPYYYALYR